MELIEVILSKENLNRAYKKVVANKGAGGVDGVTVEELGEYIRENQEKIITSLRNRTYIPKPVRRVFIPKDNGKKRPLGIPTALDRTIQQAIAQPISDIYEEIFSDYSYGFRPGRSCHDAIRQALEMVELDALVRALPQGLDTVLAEDAGMFSGGQRQRLAIARMIVQDTRIVVLDEALQKLDKRLAERIFARLLAWGEGRTMVVISHTLSMLEKLDFSYVVSYGKIIEQGTHSQLLQKTDGHYRALYDIERSQF